METVLIQASEIRIYMQSSTPEGAAPPWAGMCHRAGSPGKHRPVGSLQGYEQAWYKCKYTNVLITCLAFYFFSDDRKK